MSLNKSGGKQHEKSKVIRFDLPRTNPNIKSDIDAELDNGWHIATSFHLPTTDQVVIVFTKPKRN